MENKQTAVEWLVMKLSLDILAEIPRHKWDIIMDAVQQAKQMEKEHIVQAYQSDRYPCSNEDAIQYYNETYQK